MYDHRKDYAVFLTDLPSLMKTHNGKVVVYHNGKRDSDVFDTLSEALHTGTRAHGSGNFIAQSVVPQTAFRVTCAL